MRSIVKYYIRNHQWSAFHISGSFAWLYWSSRSCRGEWEARDVWLVYSWESEHAHACILASRIRSRPDSLFDRFTTATTLLGAFCVRVCLVFVIEWHRYNVGERLNRMPHLLPEVGFGSGIDMPEHLDNPISESKYFSFEPWKCLSAFASPSSVRPTPRSSHAYSHRIPKRAEIVLPWRWNEITRISIMFIFQSKLL